MELKDKPENFLILDSNSILHRAFHALPPLTNKDGQVINAVYGFLLMLFKVIKDFQPRYIAACFDRPEPTFRKQAFTEYKAKRIKAPDEFYAQIPITKEILGLFNIPVFEKSGYEGDDIIGTLVEFSKNNHSSQIKNIIISGDLDNLQLVGANTVVYFLVKGVKEGRLYDESEIKKRFSGISPSQIVILKALKGDASDNIPGVKGIGEKTALELIKQYCDLDHIYEEAEKENSNIKQAIKEKLLTQKQEAYLSYALSQIKKDAELPIKLEDCFWQGFNKEKAREYLIKMGFTSLSKKLPGDEDIKPPTFNNKISKKNKLKKNKEQIEPTKELEIKIGQNLKLW